VQVQGGLITALHIPPPPPQTARQLDTSLWNMRSRDLSCLHSPASI